MGQIEEIQKAWNARKAPARDAPEKAFYDGLLTMHEAYLNISREGVSDQDRMNALLLVGKMTDELKKREEGGR